MNYLRDSPKEVRIQLFNWLWRNRINVSFKEDKWFDFFSQRESIRLCLWAKCKDSYVFLMTELWNICTICLSYYWLVSFLICVNYSVGIFISCLMFFMLEVLASCGWNSVLCLFYWDYGLYVMHLSYLNTHDLVFALILWLFSLLSLNCTTKTLEHLFYLIEFIEIVLACSSIV